MSRVEFFSKIPAFLGLFALVLIIPLTAYLVVNQRTEQRGKAALAYPETWYLTELGTVERNVYGVGSTTNLYVLKTDNNRLHPLGLLAGVDLESLVGKLVLAEGAMLFSSVPPVPKGYVPNGAPFMLTRMQEAVRGITGTVHSGNLLLSSRDTPNYSNERVYLLNPLLPPCLEATPPCKVPVSGPVYLRSSVLDLDYYYGVSSWGEFTGNEFFVGPQRDLFLDVKKVVMPGPTPTPLPPSPIPSSGVNLSFPPVPSPGNIRVGLEEDVPVYVSTNGYSVTAVDLVLKTSGGVADLIGASPTVNFPEVLSSLTYDPLLGVYRIVVGAGAGKSVNGSFNEVLKLRLRTKLPGKFVISILPETRVSALGSSGNVFNIAGGGALTYAVDVIANLLRADINKDGVVDIFDYAILVRDFDNKTCGNIADIDGNCKVDIFDYNILSQEFGRTSNPPLTASNPVSWVTSTVDLKADDFYILANGKRYLGKADAGTVLDVRSDPGNANYTTLELTWKENGEEMRLFIYFKSNGSNWWSDELRTYNGVLPSPDWNYYYGNFFSDNINLLGHSYFTSVFMVNSTRPGGAGTVYFKNLDLKAFTNRTIM